MSERDAEFVADMEWLHSHDREAALPPGKLARLFAIARRKAAVQWRPIEEAPKDGTPILIFYADAAEKCAVMWWDKYYNTFMGYYDGIDPGEHPTHFMPLPPPPAGETNEF